MPKKLTNEEFIEKAKLIHGNKYDYSKVEYINTNIKVCIICPVHGEFWQKPLYHLKGCNCSICSNNMNKTIYDFIKSANKIHYKKYDYSKSNYINRKTKVCIICPEHGEFWQTPNHHLHGFGCSKCSKKYSDKDIFIEKSILVHGNKYDYSKVEYKGNKKKVCIICPKHGDFNQRPNDHISGYGCPICNESKLEIEIASLLTDNGIEYERQKHFKWLSRQSLDFYLPLYQIGIECQGRQHFEAVDYFGGDNGFKKIIERDKRKLTLCNKNNVNLIYYSNNNINYPYEVIEDKEKLINKIMVG